MEKADKIRKQTERISCGVKNWRLKLIITTSSVREKLIYLPQLYYEEKGNEYLQTY